MITTTNIKFETHDGLVATADVLCTLATKGFYNGSVHQDYLRHSSLAAVYALKDRGFDAFIDDSDVADRAIRVTGQDGRTAVLKWVVSDHGNEEGYEVVEVHRGMW